MNRIFELEELIKHHKALYYQGRPIISDAAYDKLENELKELDPTSNVLSIVGAISKKENKIQHESKMLSLNKTYKIDELIRWKGEEDIVSTFKLDGVSCSLIYEDYKLKLAKTRGDGSFGENITTKVNWVGSVPKNINKDIKSFEIRGELYCTEENFFKLSKEMTDMGLEKPTNQRNIVAGLIGRKENIELCRYIDFQAFEVISNEISFEKEVDKSIFLKQKGFQIPEVRVHKTKDSIDLTIKEAKEFMAEGDYQIDGLVFSFNKISLHNELGETSHHPRYKMAFKFAGESKVTTIESIIWNVSRNGILTPIGQVKPVELSGANISKVTLHNYGLVEQYQLKVGDQIEIIRSGEVIPKFLSVVESSANKFEIPNKCPECDSNVEISEIRIFCMNDQCIGKLRESILNFIQKIGIEDLSKKRLEEILRIKLIKSIPDLYDLTKEDFLTLDKIKEKLALKFVLTIENSKKVDLITFLASLGIMGGAYNKCEKVVLAGYDTIEKLFNLNQESLMKVDSFAEKSSEEFLKSFRDKKELIKKLQSKGFTFKEAEVKETEITGKKICITGSLSRKRSEIEKDIRRYGGVIVSGVSKNTDVLITNDKKTESSKLKKAVSLDIEILNEAEFFNKLV